MGGVDAAPSSLDATSEPVSGVDELTVISVEVNGTNRIKRASAIIRVER